jgi:hypothetical protein
VRVTEHLGELGCHERAGGGFAEMRFAKSRSRSPEPIISLKITVKFY